MPMTVCRTSHRRTSVGRKMLCQRHQKFRLLSEEKISMFINYIILEVGRRRSIERPYRLFLGYTFIKRKQR